MAKKSFGQNILWATKLERELAVLQSPKGSMQSKKSFQRDAMEIAETSEAELDALAQRLDKWPNARGFVNRLKMVIRDGRFPSCPKDGSRINCYGAEAAGAETGVAPMKFFALAVKLSDEAWFGTADSREVVTDRIDELLEQRKVALKAIRESWDHRDVILDDQVGVRFRWFPGLSMTPARDWPMRVVAHVLADPSVEEVIVKG